MSKYVSPHARPRKKRGNEYTPTVHGLGVVSAFLTLLPMSKSLSSGNIPFDLVRAAVVLGGLSLAYALVWAFVVMAWVDGAPSREARRKKQLLSRSTK